MIGDNFTISDIAGLIAAMSALMGVILAYLVVVKILRQQVIVRESLRSIEGREFYSKDEAWRTNLERKIADLNERLTDRALEFREVNHLLVDADRESFSIINKTKPVTSPLLEAMNIPAQDIQEDLVFVLTPFEKREESTYAAVVEALKSWNVRVLRGDEENVTSNILRHIVSLIAQANIVIANVASRNPNVMYELGIAQSLGKKVILISRSMDEVPFDLKHQRILLYTTRDDLISKLREGVGSLLLERNR